MSARTRPGIPVTVIVMTRNEAPNIAACLACLEAFDDVLVVDSHSTDATATLAVSLGARVERFSWSGGAPRKKQWCLTVPASRYDWILFVDADERVPSELVRELRALFAAGPGHAAYWIGSRMVVHGRVLRFGARYAKVALLDRRRARFVDPADSVPGAGADRMWEVEGHYQPLVDGSVGRLRSKLLHADDKPPFAWFDRHNRYSDWEAAMLHHGAAEAALIAGEPPMRRLMKQVFRRLPGRAAAVFLHDYVLRLGFLDGAAGFHAAVARSFYYWQITYKRRWLARCGDR